MSADNRDAFEVWSEVLGPEAGTSETYEARLKNRTLPLGNVDRAAPPPATPLLQAKRDRALRRHLHPTAASDPPTKKRRSSKRVAARITEPLAWTQVQGLHALWTEYIQDVLQLRDMTQAAAREQLEHAGWVQSLQQAVIKADWTGAMISVVRSIQPTHVHKRGILVQETHDMLALLLPHPSGTSRPQCT